MRLLAVAIALAAAACFALTSAVQQRAAKQERPHRSLDPRLLLRLARRPLWLASWAPDLAGTGLQTLALRLGPLALIQPLLASGLFLAILLEAALDRRRPRVRDVVAVGTGALGLAAFLIAAEPSAGVPDPSRDAWVAVLTTCTGSVVACLLAARWSPTVVRGTVLGVATGVLLGLTAALLKPFVIRFSDNPAGIFTDWHVYALIPVGIAALTLNQSAFQSGPLAAPLTALTLVDPVVSVVIGKAAFGEHIGTGGARLALEVVAALAMLAGTWLASTVHPRCRSS